MLARYTASKHAYTLHTHSHPLKLEIPASPHFEYLIKTFVRTRHIYTRSRTKKADAVYARPRAISHHLFAVGARTHINFSATRGGRKFILHPRGGWARKYKSGCSEGESIAREGGIASANADYARGAIAASFERVIWREKMLHARGACGFRVVGCGDEEGAKMKILRSFVWSVEEDRIIH